MCFILCSCRMQTPTALGWKGGMEPPYMTKVVVQSLWRGEQVGWYKVRGPRVSAAAVPPLPAGTTCVPLLLPALHSQPALPPHLTISSACEPLLPWERQSCGRDCEQHCETPFLLKAFRSSALWSFLWCEEQVGHHCHLLCHLLIICEHCVVTHLLWQVIKLIVRPRPPKLTLRSSDLSYDFQAYTQATLIGGSKTQSAHSINIAQY